MNNPSRGEMYKKYRDNIQKQIKDAEKASKEEMLENLAKRAGVKQKEEEESR